MGRGGLLLNYAEKCAPPPVPLPLREVACYVPDIMSCPRHDVAPNYTKLHRLLMCVRPYGEVACPRKATDRVRVTLTIQTIKHSEHFGQELISWNTLPR